MKMSRAPIGTPWRANEHMFDDMFVDSVWQPMPTLGRRGESGMAAMPHIDRACFSMAEVEAARHFRSGTARGTLQSDDIASGHLTSKVRRSRGAIWGHKFWRSLLLQTDQRSAALREERTVEIAQLGARFQPQMTGGAAWRWPPVCIASGRLPVLGWPPRAAGRQAALEHARVGRQRTVAAPRPSRGAQ